MTPDQEIKASKMKLKDIFEQVSIEQQIDDLQRRIKNAEEQMVMADDSSRYRREIEEYRNAIRQLKQQQSVLTGETIQRKFTIPRNRADKMIQHLRSVWQKGGANWLPWEVFTGDDPDTVKVVVRGKPGDRSGDVSVNDVVKFLEQNTR